VLARGAQRTAQSDLGAALQHGDHHRVSNSFGLARLRTSSPHRLGELFPAP
jgi:hypothetical protein